jgi:fatty acid desaturase
MSADQRRPSASSSRRRRDPVARNLLLAGLALNAAGALMLVLFEWNSPLRLVLIWAGVLLICAAAYNAPRRR